MPSAPKLQTRSAAVRSASYDAAANTVEIVWTAGAAVLRRDWDGKVWREILPANVCRIDRLQGRAQLFTDHDSYSVRAAIGVCVRGWIEGDQGLATVRLSKAAGDADVVGKIIDGILPNISCGYAVDGWSSVMGSDGVEERTATGWEVAELSSVGVAADIGAHVRALGDRSMDDSAKIMAAIVALAGDNLPLSKVYASVAKDSGLTPEAIKSFADGSAEPSPEELTSLAAALKLPVKLADAEEVAAPDAAEPDPNAAPESAAAPAQGANAMSTILAERNRSSEILKLAQRHGHADKAAGWVADGKTVEQVRAAILDSQAAVDDGRGVRASHSGASVTTDAADTRFAALENALLHRGNPVAHPLRDDARRFVRRNVIEAFRLFLTESGLRDAAELDNVEIAKLALGGRSTRAGGMTSSDLPLLLAAVTNKSLLQGFTNYAPIYPMIATRVDASDFNTQRAILASTFPALLEVPEGGDYQIGALVESQETYVPKRYARQIRMSVEMLTKDNLGGLTRAPQAYGRRIQMNRDNLALGIFTGNAVMSDGVAIFAAGHANLSAAPALPTIASLAEARTALGIQTDKDGIILSLEPRTWLVPKAQENAALQIVTGQFVPTSASGAPLPWMRNLQVIAHGTLDASSTTAHYLIADPADAEVLQYCEVSGQGPTLDSMFDWDSDTLKMKVIDSFGVGVVDYRGGYKNAGA